MDKLRIMGLVALACLCQGCRAGADEPAPALKPGGTFTVTFPDMPATFFDLDQKKTDPARMTVFLPTDYDPARKYPLLLLLNGSNGGAGWNPSIARALCEDKGFVCVGVPLFKATDPKGPGGTIIMQDPDARYMWPFLKTMLAKLDALVPNLDPAHQILGGFSNGAHATAGLVDQSDGEVAQRFTAFMVAEGGGRMQHYELLKGKPYLMVSSQAKSKPRAEQIVAAAKAAGAKTTFLFVDVGKHAFPLEAYPAVREWLRGPAIE